MKKEFFFNSLVFYIILRNTFFKKNVEVKYLSQQGHICIMLQKSTSSFPPPHKRHSTLMKSLFLHKLIFTTYFYKEIVPHRSEKKEDK